MSRKKSEFVSAFGISFRVFMALVNEILNQGGTDEDVRRIETDAELCKEVAALVVGKRVKPEPYMPDMYSVVVDYSMTLEQMIAAGDYSWVDKDIDTAHFPIEGAGKVEVKLQLIRRGGATIKGIMAELAERNLRPATLPELLAFGSKYKYRDITENLRPPWEDFPIIALDTAYQTPRENPPEYRSAHLPFLDNHMDFYISLKLDVEGPVYGWRGQRSFLVVAK
jgi:hypothetical protein